MGNLVYYLLTFNYQLVSDIQRRPLLKHRLGENSFLPFFSLASQVMLCPLDKAVMIVQEFGIGTWRFLSAAHFFCSCVSSSCPSVGTSTGCGPFRDVSAPVWRVSFQECISSCVHSSCPLLHASLCLFEHSVTGLLLQFFTFATTGSFSLSQIN